MRARARLTGPLPLLRPVPLLLLLPLPLLLLASCGDSGKNANPDAAPRPDITVGAPEGGRREAKLYPDLPPLADLHQKLPCESEWRDAIHAQSTVSKVLGTMGIVPLPVAISARPQVSHWWITI